MKTPEGAKLERRPKLHRPFVYDFEVCYGEEELKRALENINDHGFDLVSVTQTGCKYTVFFRRLAP